MSLTLHDEPRPNGLPGSDGVPRIGARTFVIRDSAGREVEAEFLAWGQIGEPVANLFDDVQIVGTRTDDDVIARSGVTLDSGAEYLLILVKCEGAIRDG